MFAVLKEQNYFLLEMIVILKYVAFYAPSIATNMLVQDKICLVNYNQSFHFCQSIQKHMETTVDDKIKNQILTEASRFANYK